MRYERAYTRRQRGVTFAGAARTVTIPLEIPDFERLERLATEHNVGNATLGRQIVREYLKRKRKMTDLEATPRSRSARRIDAIANGVCCDRL
jgi:hypothetical protein